MLVIGINENIHELTKYSSILLSWIFLQDIEDEKNCLVHILLSTSELLRQNER